MLSLKLEKHIVKWVINHCEAHGDTDIFPRLFEYTWFSSRVDEVSEIISNIDLNTYEPRAGVTYLTPKNLLGFRTADQLYPIDQVILLSALVSFWKDIEKNRAVEGIAFSYRIKPQKNHSLFAADSGYANWLEHQENVIESTSDAKYILSTDIADFYQRINHHRLENCLNSITESNFKKVILKQLSTHRGRYSFGIPVGNNASRMLAETLLNDTDQALLAEGFNFTRYVDDFRFITSSEKEAFQILAFLAEHLYLTEGLTLSRQKTKIETAENYVARHRKVDESAEAEEAAIKELAYSIYESEEPDPDEVSKLAGYNLVAKLKEELEKVDPDSNRVKVLLSALKSLKDVSVVPLLLERIDLMLPFMREMAILIEYLGKEEPGSVDNLKPALLQLLGQEKSYLPITRVWILDLFARGTFRLSPAEFRSFEALIKSSDVLEQRQFLLTAGRNSIQTYFRKHRTSFDNLNDWSKSAFVLGAKCLEKDEYKHWSKSIKPRVDPLLGKSLLKWTENIE